MTDKIEFTPEFIAAQREIIQGATDGNWRVGMKPEVDGEQDYPGHWVGGYTGRDEYDRDMGVYVLAAFDDGNMTAYEPEVICTPWDESDARLIAEAHNNYPAALDEIERLTAELTDARELLAEQEGLARAAEERIEALEAERDELRAALQEIHRIPLAPETRPDMPYSVIARIDSIAIVALAKGGEAEKSA
jgi:hypothetical protein